jgi:CO dehydrogenase maturation factor
VNELESNIGSIHVIANKVTDANREKLVKLAEELKLNLIGMIPLDPKIEEMDIKGIPLFEIPDDSVAAVEIENIVKKLGF